MSDQDERPQSHGDVMTTTFIHAVQDGYDPVRALCEDKVTGVKYEIVGIDRGNGDVVPMFLVPIGGAATIIDNYTVLKDDPATVNKFDPDLHLKHARKSDLH